MRKLCPSVGGGAGRTSLLDLDTLDQLNTWGVMFKVAVLSFLDSNSHEDNHNDLKKKNKLTIFQKAQYRLLPLLCRAGGMNIAFFPLTTIPNPHKILHYTL